MYVIKFPIAKEEPAAKHIRKPPIKVQIAANVNLSSPATYPESSVRSEAVFIK